MSYPPDLQGLQQEVTRLANTRTGNFRELLELLHCLEEVYIFVREGPYMESLPNTRHELHRLLKSMKEDEWPLLPKPQIQTLLDRIENIPYEEKGD
jgi:hypothetical protein